MKNPFIPSSDSHLFQSTDDNLMAGIPESIEPEIIDDDGMGFLPAGGLLARFTTLSERTAFKWGTKLAEERAKFVQAHTAIVTALRQAQEEKVRLQNSVNLHRKWYEAQMKELQFRIWELEQQQKVKEAEFKAQIAQFGQKERDASPEND